MLHICFWRLRVLWIRSINVRRMNDEIPMMTGICKRIPVQLTGWITE